MQPKAYSYIRFSSPEQEKGDSARRQVQLSEEYAKKHGLVLDDTVKLTDRGLSAYKGYHRSKGALGRFLNLVEQGEIPRGSILIVENMDRLSREQVLDALNIFTSIIKAGIKIITLQDGMEYDQQSINQNWTQLIISITYMARAHEESEAKAKRLSAAWENKRYKATNGDHILTKRCPAWLELSEDRSGFVKNQAACSAIEYIFRLKLNGMGNDSIARELNKAGYWKPPTGSWRKSYVVKILNNPAVIGHYQPHYWEKDDNDKPVARKPIGDVITDYYPKVISEDLYWSVQNKIKQNKGKGGRTGKVGNLFTYIVKCGYCGGPMAFVDKGQPPKGAQYIVCDQARRGVGCHRYYLRYDEFEAVMLEFCKGLDPAEITPGKEEVESELAQWEQKLNSIDGQLESYQSKIDHLSDSIADTESKQVRQTLEKKLSSLLDEQAKLQSEREQAQAEVDRLRQNGTATKKNLDQIKELQDELANLEGEELINFRRMLREKIRELVNRIEVYPVGRKRMTKKGVEDSIKALFDVMPELKRTRQLERLRQGLLARIDNKELRSFHIHFKSGHFRIIRPTRTPRLGIDFDGQTGQLVNQFIGEGGQVEEIIFE